MTRRDDDDTALRDAAFLGGGAFLTYLLLRGIGSGGGGAERGGAEDLAQASASSSTAPPTRPFCNVLIRGDRYELEGAPSNLATAVAACRAAGGAYIRASGDTLQRVLDDLIRALLEGDVSWFGGPNGLLEHVHRVRATMPARSS
jgi:hypothetical protein